MVLLCLLCFTNIFFYFKSEGKDLKTSWSMDSMNVPTELHFSKLLEGEKEITGDSSSTFTVKQINQCYSAQNCVENWGPIY